MLTVSRPPISRKLLALFIPVALILGAIGAPSAAAVVRKALINESTVSGPLSQEEQIATALGFTVTVVDDLIWGTMTATEFGTYDLLIAGDPTCSSLPEGLIATAPVYGPVVLGLAGGRTAAGNRIVVGTDPVFHDFDGYTAPGARGTIIREGIAYAGSQPGTTGMYFDATCAGGFQNAEILAILNSMSTGVGAWTINGEPPCGGGVSLIASNPSFTDLSTASLEGWGCSVHESFPTFRTDWSALAVATDTPSHPTCGVDPDTNLGACGEAYILIAGSNIVVNSLVISVTPLDSTNPVGTSHTVTANVHAVGGTPVVVGQIVAFSVTGQNTGATGTCVPSSCMSDASGNVTFTYADNNGAGDDTIKASFTDAAGSLQTATAQKHWTSGTKGTPTLTTTASGPVVVGATISDTAHLTGGSGTLTGSIAFQVYAPGDTLCATALTPQPTGATVTAAGDYTSGPFTTTAVGAYLWRAFFTDTDGNNNDVSTACGDTGESSTVTQNPSIAITKLPATQTIASGGTATWSIVVTNTGDVPLTSVNVTDPSAADCVKTFSGTLAVGASEAAYICTLSGITANMTNTATAHGTPPVGGEVTAQASADVVVQHGPVGLIAPTSTTCQQYLAGTAPTLPGINYSVSAGKIGQNINPGVFFYFSTVTVTANQTVTTSQSTTNSSGALFLLNNGHAFIWDSNCKKVGTMASAHGGATGSFTFPVAGTYILQLQYQTKSIAHTDAPSPINPSYTFDTEINGVEFVPDTTSISLVLK